MRVLILGGDGMLGHRLVQDFAGSHEVTATLRSRPSGPDAARAFAQASVIKGVDVRDTARLVEVFAMAQPEVVVNAVGIVKQREASTDVTQSLEVNSLLPHRLAALCRVSGARLVHVSTDCVFKGDRGGYKESDTPDATDVYGRTKLLGEVSDSGCLTLRTSIVGLELKRRRSLVEWYLAQSGHVRGFTRAVFSGVTTNELSRVIKRLIDSAPDLSGIYHLASRPISKHDFLAALTEALGRVDVAVVPSDELVLDRSLDGSTFSSLTGYSSPGWSEMLAELAGDIEARETTSTRHADT